jgi:hypothetical protein
MKLKIAEKVHVNSHVSKLGWKYPILIWPKLDFLDATQRLLPTFGDSAKRYHFKSWSSQTTPIIKGTWGQHRPLECRFYSGNRLWNASGRFTRCDFWMVFKTEKDRTLALLLIGP